MHAMCLCINSHGPLGLKRANPMVLSEVISIYNGYFQCNETNENGTGSPSKEAIQRTIEINCYCHYDLCSTFAISNIQQEQDVQVLLNLNYSPHLLSHPFANRESRKKLRWPFLLGHSRNWQHTIQCSRTPYRHPNSSSRVCVKDYGIHSSISMCATQLHKISVQKNG